MDMAFLLHSHSVVVMMMMIHIAISAKLFINAAMNPLYFEIIDSFY